MKKIHNDVIGYDTIVTSNCAAFNTYLHTFLYISFKCKQECMCVAKALPIKLGLKHQGYSVTCIIIWGVMINIVSQSNIFLYV